MQFPCKCKIYKEKYRMIAGDSQMLRDKNHFLISVIAKNVFYCSLKWPQQSSTLKFVCMERSLLVENPSPPSSDANAPSTCLLTCCRTCSLCRQRMMSDTALSILSSCICSVSHSTITLSSSHR